jgi:hypothetical protein
MMSLFGNILMQTHVMNLDVNATSDTDDHFHIFKNARLEYVLRQ